MRSATALILRTSRWLNRQTAKKKTSTWNQWSSCRKSNGFTDGSTKVLRKSLLLYLRQTHGLALPSCASWCDTNSKDIGAGDEATDAKHRGRRPQSSFRMYLYRRIPFMRYRNGSPGSQRKNFINRCSSRLNILRRNIIDILRAPMPCAVYTTAKIVK